MTRAALAAIVPCSHFPGDARVVITGARCSSCEEEIEGMYHDDEDYVYPVSLAERCAKALAATPHSCGGQVLIEIAP